MLGVGMVVPPIISAFKGSSELSARAIGTENIAGSVTDAAAHRAMISERPT